MKYLMSLLRKIMPQRYRARVRYILGTIFYFGLRFKCPCCGGHFRKFLLYEYPERHERLGVEPYSNAACPRCSSVERHRLLELYLKNETNFFTDNLKVLHIAPEPFFQQKFKTLPNLDYLSADISSPLAMTQMDITDILLPDSQFDCIICYHVLEHIPDDGKAISELFRVLKLGGWAILQSPIDFNRDKTFEDPSVTSPQEQERVFGQKGHVRIYGSDYKDRLEKAGFVVKVDNYVQQLGDALIRKYALRKREDIYICSKPE